MRWRLFVSFILVALVSILSLLILVRQGAIQEVRTYMFRGGVVGLEGIVSELEDHYQKNRTWSGGDQIISGTGQGNRRGNQGNMPGLGGMMGQSLLLTDEQGNIVADSRNPNASGRIDQSELLQGIPLKVNGATVGHLVHEGGMVFTSGDETELLSRLTRSAYIAAGIAIIFALLLALLLSTRLLKPVRELTQAAEDLSDGDLAKRVSIQGDDELAMLGRTFNQMAASLENAEQSRQAMTADIAHELRTPLAVQRAQLEALQDGVYAPTDDNLSALLEQNILLTRLVADLRTLAMAEAGQLQLEKTATNLGQLAARAADQFMPQAAEHGIEIQFSQQEGCRDIVIDPGRVEQIIGNLISNALRYTPQNSWVKIDFHCTDSEAVLTVRDNGPGITESDQEQIFERFYRADQSRSRAEGGSGLGLAIARQLAEIQDGQLTVRNHPGGGAEFQLTFPLNLEID
jgi:two-component system OmpR family sensor kinase/two-component system sensor histidine kinase BaeS